MSELETIFTPSAPADVVMVTSRIRLFFRRRRLRTLGLSRTRTIVCRFGISLNDFCPAARLPTRRKTEPKQRVWTFPVQRRGSGTKPFAVTVTGLRLPNETRIGFCTGFVLKVMSSPYAVAAPPLAATTR